MTLLLATPLLGAHAFAQYPDRTIRLVHAWAAGSATDGAARAFAKELGDRLGQSVVVDNKPGAEGIIGTAYVAKAQPDGYNLIVTSMGTMVLNDLLHAKLQYNPREDLEPLGLFAKSSFILVASNKFAATNLDEVLKRVKQQPGEVSIGLFGGITDLIASALSAETGSKLLHVRYQGGAPTLNAVLSGEVNLGVLPAAYAVLHGTKFRVIGVTSPTRLSYLPDAPTFAEQGVQRMEFANWYGVHGPRGLPETVRSVLHSAVKETAESAQFIEQLKRMGIEPEFLNAEQFAKFLAAERVKYTRLLENSELRRR
ncbi:Bug family tripartite tricarboxylate transporter substrate binding protein [Hydrogenophaga sp. BPS33]|uniref:Bug family tripartite tricarboxylate transporter substrate binding protein n=1 Tax=Hydrogenophaga sp. BPS33 TaxID=2651974 RepID=UPI00135C4C82|nr:tripartite tricarboxylate transporter substrate binding protein [Hydrogenophaga sp. BPS33]